MEIEKVDNCWQHKDSAPLVCSKLIITRNCIWFHGYCNFLHSV